MLGVRTDQGCQAAVITGIIVVVIASLATVNADKTALMYQYLDSKCHFRLCCVVTQEDHGSPHSKWLYYVICIAGRSQIVELCSIKPIQGLGGRGDRHMIRLA